MTIRLQRKIRRILATLDLADRPVTAQDLQRVTCYGPATIYPALHRLLAAGWIECVGGPRGVAAYELTARGRKATGLLRQRQPGPPRHDDGPSIAECREADRRWPLQKNGE
jgi:DNA-binding PadR family transcriptional regulator